MRARPPVPVLLLLLVAAGCFWRGYGRVLEVHLEVLESMSLKMCALTSSPPPVSAAMGEYAYPAKRAREVERHYAGWSGRPSYAGFVGVVDRYERLVRDFDRARVSPEAWSAAAPELCAQSRALAEAAALVRGQLASEG